MDCSKQCTCTVYTALILNHFGYNISMQGWMHGFRKGGQKYASRAQKFDHALTHVHVNIVTKWPLALVVQQNAPFSTVFNL